MKTLSLWQPWASLVILGHKKVETRGWKTKYRGPIAIHATATMPPKWLGASRFTKEFAEALHRCGLRLKDLATMPHGCILGVTRLVQIVETTDPAIQELSEQERVFGNYEVGRYAWFLEEIVRFNTPIPAKGNRMLWNWDEKAAQIASSASK